MGVTIVCKRACLPDSRAIILMIPNSATQAAQATEGYAAARQNNNHQPTNQPTSQPTNQPTNKQTTNNNAAFPENCLIHGRVYLIAPHCNTLMNCSNIGENVQLRPETPVLNCAKHSYKRGNIIP